eukprot:scaffold99_cov193-Alexandrium_tamarense.AAC.5
MLVSAVRKRAIRARMVPCFVQGGGRSGEERSREDEEIGESYGDNPSIGFYKANSRRNTSGNEAGGRGRRSRRQSPRVQETS